MSRRPPAVLVFLVSVTGVSAVSLITSSLPDIVDAFGVSDASAGWVLGAASMPGILLALVVGLAADRWGRVRMMVPSLLLFGVAGVASAFAPSFGVFLVLRALQGAGASALSNLSVVVLADHWPESRSRMVGRNSAAVTVSIAIFPILGGLLTDAVGWQGPFYLFAAAIPMALAVWRWIPESALAPAATVGHQLRGAARFAAQPRMVIIFWLGVATFMLLFGLVLTVAPFHAERVFGLSAGARGVLLSLPSITATLVSIGLGRLIGRHGHARLLAIGAGVYALALLGLGLSSTVVMFGAALLVVGIADAMMIPNLQDAALAGSPPEARGLAAAVFGSSARLGQTVGPAASGLLLAGLGSSSTFLVGAGAAATLGALVATVHRRRGLV